MASTFRKLVVTKLSTNFKEAVKIVTETLRPPNDDEVLLKNLYVGVNATDLNITAGRYFKHGPIPYEFGIEVCFLINRFIWNSDEFHIFKFIGVVKSGKSWCQFSKTIFTWTICCYQNCKIKSLC